MKVENEQKLKLLVLHSVFHVISQPFKFNFIAFEDINVPGIKKEA